MKFTYFDWEELPTVPEVQSYDDDTYYHVSIRWNEKAQS